ncbi:MAG TPA: ATP synthase F1 subunit delta [Fimbriimonadaceae bacterium]|nr:ATP synthase F1 subunit delta [Fimbriimonadaceae bacterium]
MAQHDARIGKRYAQALFSTAQRHDVVQAVEDDLDAIVGLMQRDKAFKDFLLAPYTSRDEKVKIIERIFSDRVTALTMQVLRVMLEKRREGEFDAVYTEFVNLRRAATDTIHVSVSSAEALDDKQKKALVAKIEKTAGKRVEADFFVEPALIGGIKVAYENFVLDGSLKGGLARLRDSLKHDLLKQF